MAESLETIKKEAEARMAKSVETLKNDLGKIRTGRAHPGLLEGVRVDYYGNKSPLSQVANISVGDPRTLTVTPWDKAMVPAIEKAIRESDLGLNPVTAGQVIRVPLPQLTEERRKELGKHVRTEGENAKIAIRNIRRDSNSHLKDALKKKLITEDEDKRAEEAVQKATDRHIAEVDKLVAAKEHDIMQV
ncbi:MAG: ribosome recycling factor [Candidatus Muproteobacteria bacterium RIFCSPHIGHO2_01_FULL_65_16]|uniref:Ribosome-recycling factor n=3 Tax=Candidatus Muproteobacteria TaxID=1817795 RepID=A0A1F6TIF1_9PROT|nr:MAG: ribosome recycling factor [Candidatus Muproteobacteria bacterium RBG_16_65_31]OGI47627.1 MAG: ribosome recycling factor [Candidatus Muproteobacteria bacterium RIFCSPHIGHO2_01_FULL_65_16]OGI52513.1 MAG: ribosome recycling factor [Candidatus Muproteobacteria bacterium RIFCSPHIGHO2_02_FULL_65_16]